MERFGFIIHPLDVRDVARKFRVARYLPGRLVEATTARMPAWKVSHITGVRSRTGTEAEGWFVGCPLTSRQMMAMPAERALDRIIQAGNIAQSLGARIVGLGAFTSVVGDAGVTVARNLDIAVTTGNSYTVATALEAAKRAASLMGIELAQARAAVVGATGSIGRVCAHILAREARELLLVDLSREGLDALASALSEAAPNGLSIRTATRVNEVLPDADLVVSVTSATSAIIEPHHLKRGAVVCDVARPRDVSRQVAAQRDDVLVIEGGVVEVPGDVDFHFDFGFPPRTAYACMSETMIMALEGSYESYTLGREITVEQVDRVAALADKHGFRLAGFRSFERPVSDQAIAHARARAGR